MYWDLNNLYGKAMSQKLPVDGFQLVENTPPFEEDLIKTTKKMVIQDMFLKLMLNNLNSYTNYTMVYHFYQKEQKLKSEKNLCAPCMIKYH